MKVKDDLLKSEHEKHQREMDEAVNRVKEEMKNGDMSVKSVQDGLSVIIADRLFFATGKTKIKPEGRKLLKRFADILGAWRRQVY